MTRALMQKVMPVMNKFLYWELMRKELVRFLAIVFSVLVTLSAPSALANSSNVHYLCHPEEPVIRVFYDENKDRVNLVIGSEVFALEQQISDKIHQRFAVTLGKNLWQVYIFEDQLSVQKNGIPRKNCSRRLSLKATPQDYAKTTGYVATGGELRDGPSSNNDIIETMKKGTPLYLLERSGGKSDGYEWFKVQFEGAKTGYLWGANICSRSAAIKGIAPGCE